MHTIVETLQFQASAKKYLSDEERGQLLDFLATHPDAGDVITGTGGFRKLRWARTGGGKRGGYRVITFFFNPKRPVFLIDIYAKNQKENLTQEEKNILKTIAKTFA